MSEELHQVIAQARRAKIIRFHYSQEQQIYNKRRKKQHKSIQKCLIFPKKIEEMISVYFSHISPSSHLSSNNLKFRHLFKSWVLRELSPHNTFYLCKIQRRDFCAQFRPTFMELSSLTSKSETATTIKSSSSFPRVQNRLANQLLKMDVELDTTLDP